MRLPSGEKNGFDAAPSKFVRRRAAPPARGTTQMSLPYANAISVALTLGERSIRVCSGVCRRRELERRTARAVSRKRDPWRLESTGKRRQGYGGSLASI